MYRQPSTNLREPLKNKRAKSHKLNEVYKTEQNRLVKLNAKLDDLGHGENM